MSGLVVLVLVLVLLLHRFILQQLTVAKSRSLEIAVVRMGLVMLAEKKDDHNKFYEQFGKVLKLGIHVDSTIDGSIALCTSTMVLVQGQLAPRAKSLRDPGCRLTPAGRSSSLVN